MNSAEGLLLRADPMPLERLLEQARALQNEQAWPQMLALLYPQEVYHAGHVAYDSLLGLAAARMGELTRAILAYERVLDAEPDNTEAKAAMAALYFRTGENKDAKALFESLRAMPLPPALAHQTDHYLRALDDRMRKPETGWTLWTSWSAGHDSNINNGTDLTTIEVPGQPAFNLTPDHDWRRKSSAMTSGLLGLRWSHQVDAPSADIHNCRIVGEGSAHIVEYERWKDFSTQTLVVDSALNCPQLDPRKQWQLGLQAKNEKRNHQTLRNSQTLRANYFLTRADASQLTTSVYLGRLQYPQDPLRDGQRYQVNLSWMAKLGPQEKWLLGSGFGVAREHVNEASRKHQGYRSADWQAHARYSVTRKTALQFYVSHQMRRHQGDDAVFLARRRDQQWLWSLALSWQPISRYGSQWTAGLTGQDNKSSIDVYSFKRLTPTLNWRAAF
jgi:hypothetical protein